MTKTPRRQRKPATPDAKEVKARTIAVYVVMRRRGHACLGVGTVLTVFLAMTLLGSGGDWAGLHTWLTLTIAGTGVAALACYLAATARTPKQSVMVKPEPAPTGAGDSPVTHPKVTHLSPAPVLTFVEQVR